MIIFAAQSGQKRVSTNFVRVGSMESLVNHGNRAKLPALPLQNVNQPANGKILGQLNMTIGHVYLTLVTHMWRKMWKKINMKVTFLLHWSENKQKQTKNKTKLCGDLSQQYIYQHIFRFIEMLVKFLQHCKQDYSKKWFYLPILNIYEYCVSQISLGFKFIK